jgi:hypothetical protein
MAVALELRGDSTALDTLRHARRLATEDGQRLRLAAQEVWLRVKFAVPDDVAGLTAARDLADSLLQDAGRAPSTSAELLAGLAMLTGRAHLAAELARRAAELQTPRDAVPTRIVSGARALLVYAALGGPVDSLRALEPRIVAEVRSTVTPAQQNSALTALLSQAAGLSFPVYRFGSLAALAGRGNFVLDALAAYAQGDSASTRRILEATKRIRETARPADRTLDITYSAAWMLAAMGDRAEAITWLDPVLNAAQMFAPQTFSRVANAGGLMRAMILRADLARQAGDAATARRWARPVEILWRNADPFLRPLVQSMHTMTSTRQGAAALTN